MKTVKNKSLKRKIITSSTSVVISLSLVLFIVGLIALVMINAQRVSDYIKENIGFTVMLEPEISEIEQMTIKKELDAADFTKNTIFISKKQATDNLKNELGEDFVQFIGYNPLLASIDVKLNPKYANNDSLQKITNHLNQKPVVFETYYQENLVEQVNKNVNKLSFFLSLFSLLLFFIAFALINNTIRLSVYSKRFLIRTMRLVGATDIFIQKPFLLRGLYQGLYSALFAILMLIGSIKLIQNDTATMLNINDLKTIGTVFVFVFFIGPIISLLSTFLAVKKYIKLNEYELYN